MTAIVFAFRASARVLSLLGFLLVLVAAAPSPAASTADIDPDLLAGLKARAIGPAGMSGRIAAVCADPGDPNTLYVGAATGGLWKSTDGGLRFEAIFDDQPVASIGAIALDPHNPDVIWVGTGEGNLRNSVSVGNGIYRSRDGGRSWEHLGLEESERIHRIYVDPRDSKRIYVAVLGKLWGDSEERGVYRSTDGGASWDRVLYVDERTGCADLELDPVHPDKLIAAMYEHRRTPWFYQSGGPGSGIWVSVDGGDTWTRRTPEDGLPEGELGRIGLAIAPSDPEVVYAYVESKEENRLYRSDDGGVSFSRTEATENVGNRPFYYADLRVDPQRSNRVYSLWSIVSVSEDGGDSFRILMPWQSAHPDHHAMWIHPADGNFIIEGNDGGVYISRDRGETWRFVGNLPVGQFYHVAVDDDLPYHIYGGMQDNGSWRGPSRVFENGGIRNHHWQEVSFGDGFDTRPMPDDSMRGYSMSQEGYLYRWDRRNGEVRSIRPAPPEGVERLRFNWNAGFAQDPFDPDTIYYGSQFVHRSRDRGSSWEVISPDLTTDNPDWQHQDESGGLTLDVTGAENFTTIVSIAPSPLQKGVLWVGTDDGRLHLTRDGGRTWQSLEHRFERVPEHTWVAHICASPHDAAAAFVALDNHRRSDLRPYVQKLSDWGARVQDLARDELRGYALVIEQDPVDPDLLFLGTEFGLYFSVDGGKRWVKFNSSVPTVSVMDLVVHPTQHDLVLGTHGRSLFVIDDIRPLRGLDASILSSPLHLFPVGDAQQYVVGQTGAERFPGATEFRGPNRPYGALLDVVVNAEQLPFADEARERARKEAERAAKAAETKEKKSPDEAVEEDAGEPSAPAAPTEIEVEILDAEGTTIRRFERKAFRGLNRLVWDLRADDFRQPPREGEDSFGDRGGPEVPPGTYTAVVRFGEQEARSSVRVLEDPRVPVAESARRARWEALQRLGALQERVAVALQRIVDARADAGAVEERIARVRREAREQGQRWKGEDDAPLHELSVATRALKKGLAALEKGLRVPPDAKGIPADHSAWAALGQARRMLGAWDRPSPTALERLRRAQVRVDAELEGVERFFAEEVPAYRKKVEAEPALGLFVWPGAPSGGETESAGG